MQVWDSYGRALYSSLLHDSPIVSLSWAPDGQCMLLDARIYMQDVSTFSIQVYLDLQQKYVHLTGNMPNNIQYDTLHLL